MKKYHIMCIPLRWASVTALLAFAADYFLWCSMEPGDEAAIVGDLGEETALLGASFMDRRVPASARKKFFSSPRNLKAYSFKPGETA